MKAGAGKRFVLDASVAVAWCFEDESTRFTESLLDLLSDGAEALVPSSWPLELANALLIGEKRKRIAQAGVEPILQQIVSLPISVMPLDAKQAFEQVLPLARQYRLSEYDAAYLEVALRHQLPLATLDSQLSRSAREAGIVLLST
ncbi:MAG: type II toxin-antitoxin system VapC family toxin [Candidatus Sulfotelmatobacter sp.]